MSQLYFQFEQLLQEPIPLGTEVTFMNKQGTIERKAEMEETKYMIRFKNGKGIWTNLRGLNHLK